MSPLQSRINQYLGLNAHLHSIWQTQGHWNRFHNVHITHLMQSLKADLLPMGYTAEIEESLQVRRLGDSQSNRPRADILVRDLDPQRIHQSSSLAANTEAIPLMELTGEPEDYEHPYSAVVISDQDDKVAWVELLSPSNKGNTQDALTYRAKRRLLLEQGLVFVELDYLHQFPPTFDRLPDYSIGEPNAHPYRIVVIDPRPDYADAQAYVHEFDVDMPVPEAVIPLNGADTLLFDFDAAYQKTFQEALYGSDMTYSVLPPAFETYSESDRRRIACRMIAVFNAFRDGKNLDQGPFPVELIPLEQALSLISS